VLENTVRICHLLESTSPYFFNSARGADLRLVENGRFLTSPRPPREHYSSSLPLQLNEAIHDAWHREADVAASTYGSAAIHCA
jgi:hypothetical protein